MMPKPSAIRITKQQIEFPESVHVGFALLSFYRLGIENQMRHTQAQVEQKFQQMIGQKLPLKKFNPFLAEDFPRYQRYSFVALLSSYAETQLEHVCFELGKVRRLARQKRYRHYKRTTKKSSNFHYTRDFLRQHLISPNPHAKQQWAAIDKLWTERIEFLRVLRNCIMHASGQVSKLRSSAEQQLLRDASKQWAGYTIKRKHVFFEQSFCEELLGHVQQFFVHLFTVFPQPKKTT